MIKRVLFPIEPEVYICNHRFWYYVIVLILSIDQLVKATGISIQILINADIRIVRDVLVIETSWHDNKKDFKICIIDNSENHVIAI